MVGIGLITLITGLITNYWFRGENTAREGEKACFAAFLT